MDAFKEYLINTTIAFVRQRLQGEGSGHDWWHTYRVWQNASFIASREKADPFIVELAAILHDVADWKLNDGDEELGPRLAGDFLRAHQVDANTVEVVTDIIRTMSFKGAADSSSASMKTLEGKVVQDSDRLDAIGAIGIARTFSYGGYKQREIYNPEIPPHKNQTAEQYKNNCSPTINHFYEKLLLLKDLMNTDTAKEMAVSRHAFMELFLKTFFEEMQLSGNVQ